MTDKVDNFLSRPACLVTSWCPGHAREMTVWIRAVWLEGEREEEGVVPENWIRNDTVHWPRSSNPEKVMKGGKAPDETWRTFPLIKIKHKSDDRKQCELYDHTTGVDTESEIDDCEKSQKRQRKKKSFVDFITGDEKHGSEAVSSANDGPITNTISDDAPTKATSLPTPPSKITSHETSMLGSSKSLPIHRSRSNSDERSMGSSLSVRSKSRRSGSMEFSRSRSGSRSGSKSRQSRESSMLESGSKSSRSRDRSRSKSSRERSKSGSRSGSMSRERSMSSRERSGSKSRRSMESSMLESGSKSSRSRDRSRSKSSRERSKSRSRSGSMSRRSRERSMSSRERSGPMSRRSRVRSMLESRSGSKASRGRDRSRSMSRSKSSRERSKSGSRSGSMSSGSKERFKSRRSRSLCRTQSYVKSIRSRERSRSNVRSKDRSHDRSLSTCSGNDMVTKEKRIQAFLLSLQKSSSGQKFASSSRSGQKSASTQKISASGQKSVGPKKGLTFVEASESDMLPPIHRPGQNSTLCNRARSRSPIYTSRKETLDQRQRSLSPKKAYPMTEEKFQRRVISLLLGMRNDMQSLLSKRGSSNTNKPTKTPLEKPLSSFDELTNLEEKLQALEERQNLVAYLSSIGGLNAKDNIRKIMDKLMTNNLMEKFSIHGSKGKLAFKKLALLEIVKESGQKSFGLTETEVQKVVAEYLKHAKYRQNK